jgi:MFS family permease
MIFKISKEQKALCCISLAWFLVLSGRYSISNLLPKIVTELDINWTLAGVALTSMWIIYAIMQFPSGILSDIKGRKIIILLSMTVFSISYLLVGLSTSFLILLLSLLLLGAGTGGYPAVGISMITDIFKEKRGKALGIRDSAGSLAYIAPILAATIASVYHWRFFFFLWAAICAFSIYLFYIGTTESTTLPSQVSIKERVKDGAEIFKNKKIQLLFTVNLLIAITWISYMSFFPALLVVEKGFTEIQAAIALGILGLGGFIFKPIIGSLSDKYDKKIIIIILSTITAIGTLIILQTESIWIIFLISFIPALATAIFPVISAYLMEQWEEKGRAGKLGFYRSNLILLGSPSSSIIGFLADKYNFIIPFIGISILLFLAASILIINLIFFNKNPDSI